MNSSLTADLNLKEYIQIIVNLIKTLKEVKERTSMIQEQKLVSQKVQNDKSEMNSAYNPVIYSIKAETDK